MEDGDGIFSGEDKPGNNNASSNHQDANNSGTVYGNGSVLIVILAVSIAILCRLIASPCGIRKRRRRSANATNGYDGIMLKASGNSDDGSNEIDSDDEITTNVGEPPVRIV